MTNLIVYDSYFGNTKKVAETIAKELGAEICFVGDFKPDMLKGVELLIVGSPIRAWNPSERTNKFLSELKEGDLKGIKAAAYDTRVRMFIHGDAANKISKKLESFGAKIIAEPNNFDVKGANGPLFEGELEKAAAWAKSLKSKS